MSGFSKSRRVIIANWKMHINSSKEAAVFLAALRKKARAFKGVEIWLSPAFPLIATLKNPSIKIGAQTVSAYEGGAHTGEVSVATLKNVGATFCLVGHSERREFESDEIVREQFARALSAKLTAVLCIGERERSAEGAHFSFIEGQLKSAFSGVRPQDAGRVIIAYEPIWAIGRSAQEAMQPSEIQEMVIFIRKTLSDMLGRPAAAKIPILYGGSVEPTNAREIITEGGVAGLLVGHASADLNLFLEILKICRK